MFLSEEGRITAGDMFGISRTKALFFGVALRRSPYLEETVSF